MHTIVQETGSGSGSGLALLVPALPDIVWGLVSFIVIFLLVWRFVIPRLNALLDARAKAIEGRIDEAKSAREEAERVLEQYQQQLAEARQEAGRIRDQARDDARRITAEAQQQAQAAADRVTAQGQAQIEANRQKAEQDLRAEVGSLALSLASAVVERHLADDKNATDYVERFLQDLRIEHGSDPATPVAER